MRAPTVWEEGRWSGDRVTRLSALLCVLLAATDLALTGHIGVLFDSGFALVCVVAAFTVRPADFFRVGVLPPLLLLGCALGLALVAHDVVAAPGDGYVQAVISTLAESAGGLMAGYGLALLVLGIRQHVIGRRKRRGVAPVVPVQPNRSGSPAPTRTTSGEPEEKSTTVVGEDDTSPDSITASRW